MTTRTDELRIEIARDKAKIVENDKLIEEAERRQSLRRQYGERLCSRLAQLEARLAREEALYVKPEGPCVTLETPDGTFWKV